MEEFRSDFAEAQKEFKELRDKLNDPVVLGTLLHKLSEERSSSNLVLKEINAKMDRLLSLEARLERLEQKLDGVKAGSGEVLLAEIDAQITQFVKEKGNATAELVQQKFGYKGRNAASSRLNRLCRDGLLAKKQVGRKMVFLPVSS